MPQQDPAQMLTVQQIEQMRAILAEYDKQHSRVEKEFDLNNPKVERYVHQEFPKMVYHHGERKNAIVRDRKEEQAHLEKGFKNEPYPNEAPAAAAAQPAESEAEEIARLDAQARQPKKK